MSEFFIVKSNFNHKFLINSEAHGRTFHKEQAKRFTLKEVQTLGYLKNGHYQVLKGK